jgi:hypothetical protein
MTMQTFSGRDYLKIDIANNMGHDKLSWDERIAGFDANEHRLASLAHKAEEPALFYAGLKAWEDTKAGRPSGYPISLDATCSGIQILAALACDTKAAALCNVIDTGSREDAYTSIYREMTRRVGEGTKIDRKLTKQAIMTAFYGSTAMPKKVFGEGELLEHFYAIMAEQAPGAWEINETMMAIWDPNVLMHSWVLPDNFHVHVKVMGQVTDTVHFLNEPFEVTYSVNMPTETGRSLGANMVHSIDGMMVREMVRRCSYDQAQVKALRHAIKIGCRGRLITENRDEMVLILWGHYLKTGFLSVRILDYLQPSNLGLVDTDHILALMDSLPARPFDLICVHDCFRCLPNYGNDLRRQYNIILSHIADRNILSSVISQMLGRPVQAGKMDPTLPAQILEANYSLS